MAKATKPKPTKPIKPKAQPNDETGTIPPGNPPTPPGTK